MSDEEEPKRVFNLLAEFPPDIWASIADLLPGEQLGRLKLTGSKFIWQRLRTINTVKRIILGQDFLHFKRWPAFLHDFPSVREVAIINTDEDWGLNCRPRLDLMPATLRKLTLNVNFSVLPLFFCGEGDRPLYMADYVPLLEFFDANIEWGQPKGVRPDSDFQRLCTLWGSELPWLTHLPTNLTTLNVDYWDTATPLPPSLIHLHVLNSIEFDSISAINVEIPPNLETLSCNDLYGADIIIPKLPVSIVALEAYYYYPQHRNQRPVWMSVMPKSLTSLKAGNIHEGQISFGSAPGDVLSCQYLQELTLNSLPTEYWHCLPQTLSKLTFESFRITDSSVTRSLPNPFDDTVATFKTVPIELLPRSITHLDIEQEPDLILLGADVHASEEDNQSQSDFFPPNLTFLRLGMAQFTLDAAKALPPSLTNLQVGHFDNRLFEYLPRGLKELTVSPAMMTAKSVKHLPHSLTSLYLELTTAESVWFDPFYANPMDAGQLMVNYSHIFDNSPTCFNQADLVLPPNLDYLCLHGFALKDRFSCQIPRQLQSLFLADFPAALTNEFISSLPRYLTSLHLTGVLNITGECFRNLPRSLTELSLVNCEEVTNAHIQHLPQTLLVLQMSQATQLNESCVIDFPRSLETIIVRDTRISRRAFGDLPYKIKSKLNTRPQTVFDTAAWCVNNGSIIEKQRKTGPVQGFFKAVSEFITSMNTFEE